MPALASSCPFCGLAPNEQRYSVVRAGQQAPQPKPRPAPAPSPANASTQDAVWYCRIGGQIVGPVSAPAIREAIAKGQIDGRASVGIKGRKEWFPLRSLPQFADLATGVGRPPTARPGAQSEATRNPPLPFDAPPAPAAGPPGTAPLIPAAPPEPGAREDETLVVDPLPLTPEMVGHLDTGGAEIPNVSAWQTEIRRYRRIAIAFGVLSAILLSVCVVFIALYIGK
jgi:hypothetical protein